MTFDELLRAARGSEELTMPESWSQGRATFGGLTAALMFERMEKLVAEGRAMRSLQVSFVGPVEPEVPASFEAEILREGKAVSQVQGRIVQKGETRLVCLASFGGDRDSQVQVGGFDLIFNGSHVKAARPTSVLSFLGTHNDRVRVRSRAQREQLKARSQPRK